MALRRLLAPATESRALTIQSLFASGQLMPNTTQAGVNVTQDSALRINALYAAVRLIADSIAMLPVDTFYRYQGERLPFRPKPAWIDQPDPDNIGRQAFIKQWLVSKLVSHAACVRILRNDSGDVVALTVLDPQRVERKRDDAGRIYYAIDGGKFRVESADMIYDAEVLRPGALMGDSRVDILKETYGLTQGLQEYASRFFGSGSTTSGVIEVPGEMDPTQAKEMQDAWEQGHKGLRKAHRPGVLSGGAHFVSTSVNPNEAQMLESREFAVEEVARSFKIPVAMLQSTKSNVGGYASREQDAIQFVTYTLLPYIEAIEGFLGALLPSPTSFVRFNVDGLLRAALGDRYNAYAQGIQGGFLTVADIRRLEDLRPIDGGDVLRVPLANAPVEAADLTATQMRVTMFQQLVNAGADPASAAQIVGLPIEHTGLPSVQLQPTPLALTPPELAQDSQRIDMAAKLIQSGFEPADVLASLGLPPLSHTGLPSKQLQQAQLVDPAATDPIKPVK